MSPHNFVRPDADPGDEQEEIPLEEPAEEEEKEDDDE
jgi:hypothetical protein